MTDKTPSIWPAQNLQSPQDALYVAPPAIPVAQQQQEQQASAADVALNVVEGLSYIPDLVAGVGKAASVAADAVGDAAKAVGDAAGVAVDAVGEVIGALTP